MPDIFMDTSYAIAMHFNLSTSQVGHHPRASWGPLPSGPLSCPWCPRVGWSRTPGARAGQRLHWLEPRCRTQSDFGGGMAHIGYHRPPPKWLSSGRGDGSRGFPIAQGNQGPPGENQLHVFPVRHEGTPDPRQPMLGTGTQQGQQCPCSRVSQCRLKAQGLS